MDSASKVIKQIKNILILNEKLDEFSSGTVYKGLDKSTKESFMIFIMTKRRFQDDLYVSSLLLKGINMIKQIYSSSVPRFIDFIESEKNYYLVTEGSNELVYTTKGLPEMELYQILLQILKAYIPFQINQNLHLQITSNSIVKSNGAYKMSSFYMFNQLNILKEGNFVQFQHLPIEILKYVCFSQKSDIWSIGCVLYEAYKGVKPFKSETKDDLIKEIDQFCLKFNEKSAQNNFETLLAKMLEPRHEKRIDFVDCLKSSFVQNFKIKIMEMFKKDLGEAYFRVKKGELAVSEDVKTVLNKFSEDNTAISQPILLKRLEKGPIELARLAFLIRTYLENLEFYTRNPSKTRLYEEIDQQINNQKQLFTEEKLSLLKEELKIGKEFAKNENLIDLDKPIEKLRYQFKNMQKLEIKTVKEALVGAYLYQFQLIKQFQKIIEQIRGFKSELETLLPAFTISKYAYFRYKWFFGEIKKDTNIFEVNFWDQLKELKEFESWKCIETDYFSKEFADYYFLLQGFRENNKKYFNINDSETFFIQFSNSLHNQLFRHNDFVHGFVCFLKRFLFDYFEKANIHLVQEQDDTKSFYVFGKKLLKVLEFGNNFGLNKVDKEFIFDFDVIENECSKKDLKELVEEVKNEYKNLIKKK